MSLHTTLDLPGKLPGERKLVAVLYADMVGYSRLIGVDDAGTLARLKRLRTDLIDPAIDEHRGRIVQTGGDSLLVVFDSIDGAVRCAMKVQQQVPDHDEGRSAYHAIRFRMGIDIGDAIADGTDLHGDGVIVAARLQAECPSGGVCVSRAVRDHVHDRLDLTFESLGLLNLKNISRPVEAFLVRVGEVAGVEASKEPDAPPLPDRPSIAVLPFQNMSGDPEQEYFADGIVEEIITALSRVPSFFVIARNSTFAYKGKSPDVRRVGKELGARYVLEGSVRKASSRVRITGQLIDATTGAHLWAHRFEGDLSDIFELQDQVTIKVVGAIAPKIRSAEITRALHKATENLAAYDLVLRGRWAYDLQQRDSLEVAADFYRRAITLDPNYAVAYALLAMTLWITAAFQWTKPSERELSEYVELAKTAIRLGQHDPEALAIAAYIVGLPGGELEEGIAVMDRALAQNPNSADTLAMGGTLRAFLGDTQTALQHLRMAERMAPLDVHVAFKSFGFYLAAFVDGDYPGVIDGTAKLLREDPANVTSLRYRASALALAGRLDEARRTVAQLLTAVPEMTIRRCRRHVEIEMKNPFKRPGVAEAYYEGLRLAGLPE
jgi:adenylate cyclase